MASFTPIPPTPLLGARTRPTLSDIMETIARSREVIQQARDAMVRANLISERQADQTPRHRNHQNGAHTPAR